jgi:superfamily II DNA or RNA helicase
VILDEIHHAGDERAWGESLLVAFEHARRRLALSGTPFRSDTKVNGELNRLAGLRRVAEATTPQLENRIRRGEAWFASLLVTNRLP